MTIGRFDSRISNTTNSSVLFFFPQIPRLLMRLLCKIVKNRQTKCTGLSLALFMFAILGNVSLRP